MPEKTTRHVRPVRPIQVSGLSALASFGMLWDGSRLAEHAHMSRYCQMMLNGVQLLLVIMCRERAFRLMRQGAILVNYARGEVIDKQVSPPAWWQTCCFPQGLNRWCRCSLATNGTLLSQSSPVDRQGGRRQ